MMIFVIWLIAALLQPHRHQALPPFLLALAILRSLLPTSSASSAALAASENLHLHPSTSPSQPLLRNHLLHPVAPLNIHPTIPTIYDKVLVTVPLLVAPSRGLLGPLTGQAPPYWSYQITTTSNLMVPSSSSVNAISSSALEDDLLSALFRAEAANYTTVKATATTAAAPPSSVCPPRAVGPSFQLMKVRLLLSVSMASAPPTSSGGAAVVPPFLLSLLMGYLFTSIDQEEQEAAAAVAHRGQQDIVPISVKSVVSLEKINIIELKSVIPKSIQSNVVRYMPRIPFESPTTAQYHLIFYGSYG